MAALLIVALVVGGCGTTHADKRRANLAKTFGGVKGYEDCVTSSRRKQLEGEYRGRVTNAADLPRICGSSVADQTTARYLACVDDAERVVDPGLGNLTVRDCRQLVPPESRGSFGATSPFSQCQLRSDYDENVRAFESAGIEPPWSVRRPCGSSAADKATIGFLECNRRLAKHPRDQTMAQIRRCAGSHHVASYHTYVEERTETSGGQG